MARSWYSSETDTRGRRVLLALACACFLASCGTDGAGPSSPGADGAEIGSLPEPAGTPGMSVTGMPTTSPPPPVQSAEPVALPTPVDPTAIVGTEPPATDPLPTDPATLPVPLPADPAAPPPESQPVDVDPSSAARAMTEYMAAISSGSFARAQQQWAAAPTDSAVLDLARSPAFSVDIGSATGDPAGRPVATVPVQIRGLGPEGGQQILSIVYTLQRGTGTAWRIVAASIREGSP